MGDSDPRFPGLRARWRHWRTWQTSSIPPELREVREAERRRRRELNQVHWSIFPFDVHTEGPRPERLDSGRDRRREFRSRIRRLLASWFFER
jgi:hypothetical protein